MFAEYWNIMKIKEGAHQCDLERLQNGDVLGEALNNFQTMTLHHLIQRLWKAEKCKLELFFFPSPGKKSKV